MPAVSRYSLKKLAAQLGLDAQLLRALGGEPGAHYSTFSLRRPGKKPREIDNPDEALKLVQRRIRTRLLADLPLPDHVHGCVRGRSPVSNAKTHLGRTNVASVDVKDFYPGITNSAVFALWCRLGFGPPLASLLTKLTTRNGHLPQGAPTSDALANHFMAPVDREIAAIADALDLSASRYLDNIDLSGDRAREAIPQIIAVLRAHGLAVRHKKVFNVPRNARQTVTGYTVNGLRPSVSRWDQRKVRSAVWSVIEARRRGLVNGPGERAVEGRLAHLALTNPGAARALRLQLKTAGIRLARKVPVPSASPEAPSKMLPRVESIRLLRKTGAGDQT